MRNTVMTGPIILSKEDSSRLRQNILHPTVEYLQEQERYFEEIASSNPVQASSKRPSTSSNPSAPP